jgi:hypothetical protein
MSGDGVHPEGAAGRLAAVRERIERAARRAGRDPDGIAVLAVSKTVPVEGVLALARAGQRLFAENRIQEARDKIPAVNAAWDGPALRWHLVGHLQRNKVKPALALFDRIDSVDSFRLLEAAAREAEGRSGHLPVLLQFNCSGEATKGGFVEGDIPALARALKTMPAVDPRGLMTIGPLADDPETARPAFRSLVRIRDALAGEAGRPLPELSMGMSGDLEVGVEEGATVVRVGTALFGARD